MARPNADAERKKKEKKQKIIAAVGGVLLLALLGLQGPSVLAKLNQKPPPLPGNVLPPNGNPPGQTTPSLAAPTLAGGSAGTGAGGGGGGSSNPASGSGPASSLAVFEVAPDPAQGQLRSFNRFVSKDPFQQQIAVDSSGNQIAPAGGSGSSPSKGSTSGSAPTPAPGGAVGGSGGASGSSGSPSTPVSPVASVRISVNDAAPATVGVGTDFPADNPAFHLVAATTGWAKIAIAGGSYADGRSTITLRVGKPITLENTADGTRYKLVLVGSS